MTGRARRGLAAMLGAVALSSAAAVPSDPILLVYKLLAEGRDLSATDQLYALAFRKDGSVKSDMAAQSWQQYTPRLNGLTVPLRLAVGAAATPQDIAAVRAAERRDAIETIVAMARDRRIVVLNEAHDDPKDRAFGLAVAKALRPLGFTMFAAETFNNDKDPTRTDMAALVSRGYPTRQTGAYTADPVFGDFVRQTLALGYQPVAYEQTQEQEGPKDRDGSINVREEAEASNLAAAFARAPQAKFFVYVGYSHATKTPLPDGESGNTHLWMAGRLKQKTGLDPLTIDQTGLGSTNPSQASRTLRSMVKQGIDRPVVLFANGKPLRFGQYHDAVDLQVVYPSVRIVHGRPDWLKTIDRHPVRPPARLVPKSGRALVQAFLTREGPDAIPVDQVVLEPHDTRWFMLPNEPVRFVVKERAPTL